MRKLLLIIGMVFILGGLAAQDETYTLKYPVSYYGLPYRTRDSVSSNSNDSTWYFQWLLQDFDWPNKTDVKVTLDELSGTGSCDVSLQGKKFIGDSWTNITTQVYGGGGSDSTFTISDGTARLYRYYRLLVDKRYAVAGKVEVDLLEIKVWQTQ
jgi:hypothetical protein